MPLDRLQTDILRLLAAGRDAESFVAGSTPLNQSAPRYSGDIDIFHDRQERVAVAAEHDAGVLVAHGFDVTWLRKEAMFRSASVRLADAATRLEWVADSDFRFFPARPDPLFGFALHPIDLATNKAMAAAGRREPRDVVDLLAVHDTVLPLGAVIWAAVGKSLGFTPEALINEIRRLGHYVAADFASVISDPPIDPGATLNRLRALLWEAEAFVMRMPSSHVGLLFLEGDRVVQPDPDRLGAYATHEGRRGGHWPNTPGLTAALLEARGTQA